MKRIIAFLAIAGVILAIPASNAVDFEVSVNDMSGDVSNPDIDITKVWTTVEGDKLVFHMQVAGNIDTTCIYQVMADNGPQEVGAIYSNGHAVFAGTTSAGQPEVNINGDTITIKMPYGIVSSWNSFTIKAVTHDNSGNTDWALSTEGGGEEGDGGNEETTNPGDETPTDKSIDVKITSVKYSIEKSDGGTKWHTHVIIEGTTNGVDHVSLSFVTYYKNGSYDVSGWMKGPVEIQPGSFMGNEITTFFFNSTEGNWNKWKLEIDAKYPVTEPTYEWVDDSKEVDKFVIYARAFKDAEETKWNQAKYETKPSFTSNGAVYNMGGSSEENEGGKTPGFEMISLAIGISAVAILRRKK